MDDLLFTEHALDEMARDNITVEAVYHVLGDADEVLVQTNGRTRYIGTWQRRGVTVVVEDDEATVVTVWEPKRESRYDRRGSERWS